MVLSIRLAGGGDDRLPHFLVGQKGEGWEKGATGLSHDEEDEGFDVALLTDAVALIQIERTRQQLPMHLGGEEFTLEYDDSHDCGELADAAATYAASGNWPELWPFQPDTFRPGPDRLSDLVKAGALIVAEIERLQRQKAGSA